MELGYLDGSNIEEALQYVLADPYLNALMIADLTALRDNSEFVYARDEKGIMGLLSLYSGMSFPAIAIWCDEASLLRKMTIKMSSRHPRFREDMIWCLGGKRELGLLAETARIVSAREEMQMKLELAGYKPPAIIDRLPNVVSLSISDVPDLNVLYEIVPPEIWRPEEVTRGPYKGIYEDGNLVAAAGVHWVSPWIAEIGNVAVHPDFRRRGLAEACVGAVVEDLKGLTERVYLMVFAENEPAINLYRKMGFEEVQRMWLVEFKLPCGYLMPRRVRGRISSAGKNPEPATEIQVQE